MPAMRKAAGILALVLGAVGLAVGLAALLPLWKVCGRLDRATQAIAGRSDAALARVADMAQSAADFVAATQADGKRFVEAVQARAAARRGQPADRAGLEDLARLEGELRARFELAGAWIEGIQSSLDLAEQGLDLLESLSQLAGATRRTKEEFLAAAQAAQSEYVRTQARLDDVRADLARIAAAQDVEAGAARIATAIAAIDRSLATIRRHTEGFARGVAETRGDLAALATRVHHGIRLAGLAGTAILLWFAAAQACLAVTGWRALRGPRPRA